jgi:hypothetical protein
LDSNDSLQLPVGNRYALRLQHLLGFPTVGFGEIPTSVLLSQIARMFRGKGWPKILPYV